MSGLIINPYAFATAGAAVADPVEYIASTNLSASIAATVSVPVPASAQPGDLLLCAFSWNGTGIITDMDGWTLLYSSMVSEGGDRKTAFFYLVAPDPVPASYTFSTNGTGTNYSAHVSAFRNQSANVPVVNVERLASGTSVATPSLDFSDGSLAYALWRTRSTSNQPWTLDADLTTLVAGSLGGNLELGIGYEAGMGDETKSYTATKSDTQNTACNLLSIRPVRAGDDEEYWARVRADGWTEASFDQRLGYVFTVGASDIKVNRLRMYRGAQNPELVIIHRESDGAVITSATVPGQYSAVSRPTHNEVAVSEVVLSAGVTYVISHRASGSTRLVGLSPSSVTYTSGITIDGYRFSTDDNKPDLTSSNEYVAADFGYVIP